MRRLIPLLAPVALAALAALAVGCADDRPEPRPPATVTGDVAAGRQAIADLGCGACHRVPGVRGADALVGPPLDSWSKRSFIAGTLPNTPRHLERWIRDPQEVEPGTAMPDLDVSELEARDIAAYLFSLE